MAWNDNEIDKVIQILIDLRANLSSGGNVASESTLQDCLNALQNISIDADSVNLNTDQLEAKLDSVIAELQGRLDTVANATPVTDTAYNVSGVIAINTDLLTIDCSQLRSLSIHAISIGTTGVVTPAWSNDGTNFVNDTIVNIAGTTATTFNATGLWTVPVKGRFFRLRLTTATTAGTTNIRVAGFQQDISTKPLVANGTQPVSGTVTANLGANSTITNIGSTAQGASTYSIVISNATNSLTQIKSGATTVNSIHISNSNNQPRYLKIFNALSASVTMGTTNAILNYMIPAGQSISINTGAYGIRFATGFTIAITSGVANNDNTSAGANEVVVTTTYF